MCVNMIPHVINAEPGLHTMITLPIPRAIMGDMRNLVREDKKLVKQSKNIQLTDQSFDLN